MNSGFVIFAITVIVILLFIMYDKFIHKLKQLDPRLGYLKEKISKVIPAAEHIDLYQDNKSYTLDKKRIYLCLKDKKSGEYYDDNMMTMVYIHELAHVFCDEVGHTEKFYKIFHELLDKAIAQGLYDPAIPPIDDYCE